MVGLLILGGVGYLAWTTYESRGGKPPPWWVRRKRWAKKGKKG